MRYQVSSRPDAGRESGLFQSRGSCRTPVRTPIRVKLGTFIESADGVIWQCRDQVRVAVEADGHAGVAQHLAYDRWLTSALSIRVPAVTQ